MGFRDNRPAAAAPATHAELCWYWGPAAVAEDDACQCCAISWWFKEKRGAAITRSPRPRAGLPGSGGGMFWLWSRLPRSFLH
eukprot:scaffold15939_cov86-Isochrysis_galbana.AAC.2